MLVLRRRAGQSLVFSIDGIEVATVTISEAKSNEAKVAITALPHVNIAREELLTQPQKKPVGA